MAHRGDTQKGDPDQRVFYPTLGAWNLIGVALMALGLTGGLMLMAISPETLGLPAASTYLCLGLIPFAGLILSRAADGVTINRRTESVEVWSRFLLYRRKREYSLQEYTCIRVSRLSVPGIVVYSVILAGEGRSVILDSPPDIEKALQMAEVLGRFLGLRVEKS